HLQDLSVEVITPILDGLAVRDLLLCRQVSRYLLEVIDGSERLQYKIDLAVAGMIDGPPSALCTAERRRMLREHQKAWDSLEFSVQPTLSIPVLHDPLPAYYPGRIFGNVLWYYTSTGLRFIQLPSRIRGTEEKRWTIDYSATPGFTVSKFAMDPAQDLLVVLERQPQTARAQIRILCMSNGTAHPAAVSAFLYQDGSFGDGLYSELQTQGDAVGWLIFSNMSQPRTSIQVWNWKTGDWVWDLPVDRQVHLYLVPQDFSFLDDNHMIVLYERRLAVYEFDTRATTTTKTTSKDFVVSLDVPIRTDSQVMGMSMYPRASSSAGSHGHPDTPFERFPSDSLIVIEINFEAQTLYDTSWLLFVPASTIRACVARARKDAKARDLKWQAWGSQGARIMRRNKHVNWYAFNVQGTRAVAAMWPKNNRNMARIHVFEFGPVVQHHIQTCMLRGDAVDAGDGLEEGKATYVTTAYDVDGAGTFFTDVTTQLPFRTSWRNVDSEKFSHIMLCEDGIVWRWVGVWHIHTF
ncbi:hypothetical protein B0H21DRAFT_857166, partial [Amylocystis lapponica]